ncbi:MAG TPA: glycosyltransferase [Solirubrobacteraceae bacterium]|jgi:GT2 family glycosyltransferase
MSTPTTTDLPRVTVNQLAYNRRDQLAEALEHLHRLDYPADKLEFVVVDNASSDGTSEMLAERFGDVRVERQEVNEGVPGWNHGFRAGTGEWFLVLDDDCYVEGDALRRALVAAEEEGADLVSFGVRSHSRPDYRFDQEYRLGLIGFWGCAVLIHRRVIEALGGYDPEIFLWAHEAEFMLRVLDRGFRHLHLPEIVAVHIKDVPYEGEIPARTLLFNAEHLAYIAARRLQTRDAVVASANVLLNSLSVALKRADVRGTILQQTVAGIRRGARLHEPVRPEVSSLYRRHFHEFLFPLRWMRSPLRMLSDRRAGRSFQKDLRVRQQRFWDARPDVYPSGRGSLKV